MARLFSDHYVMRAPLVCAENSLGNDVTSFCSSLSWNFWEINETHEGVNKPMVSNSVSVGCHVVSVNDTN